MSPQPAAEVVVVGGGMAGLTAAAYLARAGVPVRLYEKSVSLGGRAATQNYDEYHFNRGIHALYCGGATESVLQELGVAYTGQSPKGILALRQGKLHVAPYDAVSLLRTDLFGLADKLELMRAFMNIPQIDAHALRSISVQRWIEQNLQRPAVRQFFSATARSFVYSTALDLVSAEVFIQKTQIAAKHPVRYIDGGWQHLVDGLHTAAENAGAHIISGTRVESIEYQDGAVRSVRLRDGSTVPASAVIIATTPQDAVKLVNEGAYPALRQIVDALVPAQLACLDVALSRLPVPHHPVVQDVEQPRFMSVQSLFSRIAPENGALIYSFKQLDPRQSSDPHQDETDLEALLDTAQPGWREVTVKRQYLPRIEAVGTLPTASGGGFAGRPDIQVPGLSGLYLAGDWIGAEGFLSDASMASARLVAQRIIQQTPVESASMS